MPMQHPAKIIMKIKLTIVLLIMAVKNTIKVIHDNVQHWPTDKISFYNIRTEDPDILLLKEYGVRKNGKILKTKPEIEQQ